MLLLTALVVNVASAQTTSTEPSPPVVEDGNASQWHPGGNDPYSRSNPNQPLYGSQAGRGLPGGKDPSIKIGASYKLSDAGDVAAKKGDWETAGSKYQAALDTWADNTAALYGLAKCAETNGNLDAAIGYYRTAIYSHDPKDYAAFPGDGFRTNDVTKMMDFVLALSRDQQDAEAQKVYKQAAYVLNYEGSKSTGKPFLRVLLPEFGTAPGDIAETPERLQAMAYVALSLEHGEIGNPLGIEETQNAVRLYPDSPVANYYLGEQLLLRHRHEAKTAFIKAAQLGDPQVKAEAHKWADDLP